jgi:proteasome assembly chaperone (PAC2) family protein
MTTSRLKLITKPELENPSLIISFSGWMNGGDISTGTVRLMVKKLKTEKIAEIDSRGLYIFNFPGSMEVSALFRPHVKIEDGTVVRYDEPANTFYADYENNLILFTGKEPHVNWHSYSDAIFELCRTCGVKDIYFIGSVAGVTPHTREPRIICSVSDEKLKDPLEKHGFRFTNYEGPSSIITYLLVRSAEEGLNMTSLIAEIPAYVHGYNPKCVETAVRVLSSILGLHIPLDDLRSESDDFEKRLSEMVSNEPELAEKILELEQAYDEEVFENEMSDLKNWLQQKGIRLD